METEKEIYVDPYLKDNFELLKKAVKRDWDAVIVVDGIEGSGKSVIAQQIAKYCDPTFCIERIVFTPDDFKNAVISAQKYQAVIFDEARSGLNVRRAMSSVNNALTDMLAEIRQKNLFIFMVMPTFFDMDKNVACWRARALVHVYVTGNFKRGYYKFFNSIAMRKLYMRGKKYYDYSVATPSFKGTFPKPYVVDEEKYRQMKNDSLRMMQKSAEKDSVSATQKRIKGQRDIVVRTLWDLWGRPTLKAFAQRMKQDLDVEMSERNFQDIVKPLRDQG
jgi:hypothetical protein